MRRKEEGEICLVFFPSPFQPSSPKENPGKSSLQCIVTSKGSVLSPPLALVSIKSNVHLQFRVVRAENSAQRVIPGEEQAHLLMSKLISQLFRNTA